MSVQLAKMKYSPSHLNPTPYSLA